MQTFFPKYESGAEAHIHPHFVWKIPSVSEKALTLVNGNKMLLANTPDIILKQPIEICAPKVNHERWFTQGSEDYFTVGIAICSFIDQFFMRFSDDLQSIDDYLKAYESSDTRLLIQQFQYVYVATAYVLKGNSERAMLVLENHLGNAGLRKKYAAVYENI